MMNVDLNNPILAIKPDAVKDVEKQMRRSNRRSGARQQTPNMRYAGESEWNLQAKDNAPNQSQKGFQSINLGNFKSTADKKDTNPIQQGDEGFRSFVDQLKLEEKKKEAEAQAKIDAELAEANKDKDAQNAEATADNAEEEHAQTQKKAVPAGPSISEEMLQTLHDNAYSKGVHDGRQLATQSFEQEKEDIRQKLYEDLYANDSNELLHKLGRNIYQHIDLVKDTERDRDVHLLTLMLEIFRKIMPGMVKKYGTLEIENFLKEIIELTHDNEPLQITLPKYDGLDLTEQVSYILRGKFKSDDEMERFIKIHEDEKLAASDCRVSWKNGMATRSFEDLWADIERILSRHMWLALSEDDLKETKDKTSQIIDDETGNDVSASGDNNPAEEMTPAEINAEAMQTHQPAQEFVPDVHHDASLGLESALFPAEPSELPLNENATVETREQIT